MTITYRGYKIERHPKGGFTVRKDGMVVTSQPSVEFAKLWIDGELS